ncbi:metal-dependent transcriptional regulator [Halococcoides cellulosivorans]|uniref:DtxR family transcriptional regulator n=1 Tax=Halococcoides cellulosivorans TaxID=1679096 RepID=A0A2R4WYZ8_9EURY|nr:metal-dependent transcriptional regulator [Halococcoides cellulosivorans]AWB26763.1 DtxR family transcriptional regulator [Halococcoides cellulosivorans]
MPSETIEDYLKAIYHLQRTEGPPVSTSAVADRLDVTPPTATSMLKKLAAEGLLDREEFAGVEVTDAGEAIALEVIRHHRLIERFLADELDYDWTAVHDEADALEHHISEQFEDRLAEALGDPAHDPHGDPIPTAELDPIGPERSRPLVGVDPGTHAQIARVADRDADQLEYLAERGIEPGCLITVLAHTPIDTVAIDGPAGRVEIPVGIAESIRVHAEADPEAVHG